ncbi:peptide-methionine (S)-S-oxide reductase [Fragilaria crotonensis]|nr:peptide-methionine (S)-S-oxide reductase [Fragilaria crotonensis]
MGQSASKESFVGDVNTRKDGPVLDCAQGPTDAALSNMLAIGGGCFWGIEHYMTRNFQNRFPNSILSHRVGFMTPDSNTSRRSISYQEVSRGKSGYVEVLLVELRDPQAHLEDFLRFFFCIHDPTTHNRQGADRGSQYHSVIFCSDQNQQKVAEKIIRELQQLLDSGAIQCFERKTVQTRIVVDTSTFVDATERHQNYLSKNPNGYWQVTTFMACCVRYLSLSNRHSNSNHFVRSRGQRPPR